MSENDVQIPELFLNKLSQNQKGKIFTIFADYASIVEDNKLTFFPEYTDHGIKHIQNVILSAENLITDDTYNYLNPEDTLSLLLSIFLHDLAMHLSTAGFERLINNQYSDKVIDGFDKLTWRELWNDFLIEARKFNDEQIQDIWGTKNVEIKVPDFRNYDDYSKKLIGEFLRRHHARLAHEIALWGFPGKDRNINILSDINLTLRDIIGLISRSHGIELRDTFEYLLKQYSVSMASPHDVKIFFLMVVLRIADYIQVDVERAPQILLKVKRFSSPISLREWEKHNSIEHINYDTTDPELIFIIARPTNSQIYLELSSLFTSIQMELDRCWAVLGEVYGRHEQNSKLKIKYRRIKSNIDDKQHFSLEVNYVPEHVIFDADPELLKLLVGPLYDNDPQYGVRELLQNSVDAVLEKQFIMDKEDKSHNFIPQVDVILEFKKEELNKKEKLEDEDFKDLSLTFIDNGIGMNEHVLINYFLKAGASFRKSNIWRRNFFELGHSEIQRTGKFGIGVLAGFLLGDTMEIYTKHMNSNNEGLYLRSNLNERQIDIFKIDTVYGTKIIIDLNENVCQWLKNSYKKISAGQYHSWENVKLNWFDWYKMTKPNIKYHIPNNIKSLFNITEYFHFVPSVDQVSPNWREFNNSNYKNIKWTFDKGAEKLYGSYDKNKALSYPMLICNGFMIPYGYTNEDKTIQWDLPRVSVYDFDSQLPLSLNRNYIFDDKLPFFKDLNVAIAKDIISRLLTLNFKKTGNFFYLAEPSFINYATKISLIPSVVVIGNSYILSHPLVFHKLKITKLVNIWFNKEPSDSLILKDNLPYIARKERVNNIRLFNELFYTYNSITHNWFSIYNDKHANFLQKRFFLKSEKYEYLAEKNRLRNSNKMDLKEENLNINGWCILTQLPGLYQQKENVPKINSVIDLNMFKTDFNNIDFIIENDLHPSGGKPNIIFEGIFSEYFKDDFLIPIEIEERKSKYKDLFKALEPYIKRYLA